MFEKKPEVEILVTLSLLKKKFKVTYMEMLGYSWDQTDLYQ